MADPTLQSTDATNPTQHRSKKFPLYLLVLIAVTLAVPSGLALGIEVDPAQFKEWPSAVRLGLAAIVTATDLAPRLIIRALGALAAPLVVLAILSALVTNRVEGRQGLRMMAYYLSNTAVAMTIGLIVTNLINPGGRASIEDVATGPAQNRLIDQLIQRPDPKQLEPQTTVGEILTQTVPRSVGDAFSTNNLAQLVLIAVVVGIAMNRVRDDQERRGESSYRTVVDLFTVGFELLMKVLLWIVGLVPIAVFGVVTTSLAREGFGLFLQLGWFVAAVVIGLLIQLVWYLGELGLFAKMSPPRFLNGAANVIAMTMSTASTSATMPITLKGLTERLGISRVSSQLAACVGTNFNNDGTALYQATVVLFLAQASGANLGIGDQLIIMVMTLLASVGAGGIPSGSFVTLPLIFAAVGLPTDRIPILLALDWFLDRCRTTINVLGDMTVAILIDQTEPSAQSTVEDLNQ